MKITYQELSEQFSERRKRLEDDFDDLVSNVVDFVMDMNEGYFRMDEEEELSDWLEFTDKFIDSVRFYLKELDDETYCEYFDAFQGEDQEKKESLAESVWLDYRDNLEAEWESEAMCDMYVDDKGNLFSSAAEYCKEYNLPLMTEDQLIETGDLMRF